MQKCQRILQEGGKVKALDLLDGVVTDIGHIHSLSIIHGVKLSPKDVNVNIRMSVANNFHVLDSKLEIASLYV